MITVLRMDNAAQVNRDIRRMREAFRRLPSKVGRKYCRKAVTEATKPLRQELRRITPKGRTGNLRKGIAQQFKYSPRGAGLFKYRLGFDRKKAPHALLLEFGTKKRRTKKGANRGRGPTLKFFRRYMEAKAANVGQRIAAALRKYLEAAMKEGMP
jgi:HK97 gp10 family phage protein